MMMSRGEKVVSEGEKSFGKSGLCFWSGVDFGGFDCVGSGGFDLLTRVFLLLWFEVDRDLEEGC